MLTIQMQQASAFIYYVLYQKQKHFCSSQFLRSDPRATLCAQYAFHKKHIVAIIWLLVVVNMALENKPSFFVNAVSSRRFIFNRKKHAATRSKDLLL